MKLSLVIALLVGFAIGFAVRSLIPAEPTTADHWRFVHQYLDYERNPANYDEQTGWSATELPQDLMPSLAALVSAGELRHLDIVLPTVAYSNREATRYWMAFCERHKDEIVYALGNPRYVAFPTKGEQPLHLQLWFAEESTPVVQQLISELEEMGTREEPARDSIHAADSLRISPASQP